MKTQYSSILQYSSRELDTLSIHIFISGSVKPQVHNKNPFCTTVRGAISLRLRRSFFSTSIPVKEPIFLLEVLVKWYPGQLLFRKSGDVPFCLTLNRYNNYLNCSTLPVYCSQTMGSNYTGTMGAC